MFIIPTSLFRNIIIHYYFDIAGLVHSLDWTDGKLESWKAGKPGKLESQSQKALESWKARKQKQKDRTGIIPGIPEYQEHKPAKRPGIL